MRPVSQESTTELGAELEKHRNLAKLTKTQAAQRAGTSIAGWNRLLHPGEFRWRSIARAAKAVDWNAEEALTIAGFNVVENADRSVERADLDAVLDEAS